MRQLNRLLMTMLLITLMIAANSLVHAESIEYLVVHMGTQELTIDEDATSVTVQFVAPRDGYYIFESTSTGDTYSYLYRDDFTKLAFNDNSGDGDNFLITAKLTEGQLVFLKPTFYDRNEAENCPLALSISVSDFGWYFNNSDGSATLMEYCGNEEDVVIPGTMNGYAVKRISNQVFLRNQTIKRVVIPEGVEQIGNSAFQECNRLNSVSLPSTLQVIGSFAFHTCNSLTSINIPENVTSIKEGAFAYCRYLTNVSLPTHMQEFGSSVFSGCENLINITLPSGLSKITDNLFSECTSLQTIILPDGITSIGNWAFQNCSNLQSIVIPETTTSIGSDAFYDTKSLKYIYIPDSVEQIGSYALAFSPAVIYCHEYSAAETYAIQNSIPYVLIDAATTYTLENLPTSITQGQTLQADKYCFPPLQSKAVWSSSNTDAAIVDQQGTITAVGGGSTTITCKVAGQVITAELQVVPTEYLATALRFPSSDLYMTVRTTQQLNCITEPLGAVTNLNWESSNTLIATVDQQGNITCNSIGTATIVIFDSKTGLQAECTVHVTRPVTPSAEKIVIPDGISFIEEEAFCGSGATAVILSDSVKVIYTRAFAECSQLASIQIPSSTVYIANDAFTGCSNLTILCEQGSYADTYAQKHLIPVQYQ